MVAQTEAVSAATPTTQVEGFLQSLQANSVSCL